MGKGDLVDRFLPAIAHTGHRQTMWTSLPEWTTALRAQRGLHIHAASVSNQRGKVTSVRLGPFNIHALGRDATAVRPINAASAHVLRETPIAYSYAPLLA